jgi:hypothetical protein
MRLAQKKESWTNKGGCCEKRKENKNCCLPFPQQHKHKVSMPVRTVLEYTNEHNQSRRATGARTNRAGLDRSCQLRWWAMPRGRGNMDGRHCADSPAHCHCRRLLLQYMVASAGVDRRSSTRRGAAAAALACCYCNTGSYLGIYRYSYVHVTTYCNTRVLYHGTRVLEYSYVLEHTCTTRTCTPSTRVL